MAKRWYVATTKTNHEELAQRELRKQGYLSWSPRVRTRIRVKTRNGEHDRLVNQAYFPNYVFVKFDAETDRWHPVMNTKGIVSLIVQNELPIPVRVGVIERLIDSADENDFMIDERAQEVLRDLRVGEEVKIVQGAFSGFSGPIKAILSQDRIRVMLQVFGRDNPVEVSRESVA